MKPIREHQEIKKVLGNQLRSKAQVNSLFESDCEIVKVSKNNFIATSTDSIGEEITLGLYRDIDTWSWMTVMSSVSDLSASGASALGLTLSAQWAFGTGVETQKKFYSGVHKACKKSGVPLLGGDSGYAKDHVFTSTITGHSTSQPLMRSGIQPDDYIVLIDQKSVGLGPALAFAFLYQSAPAHFGHRSSPLDEKLFRPTPDWKLAQKLRPYARAAMDTSDGIASSLHTLCVLNDLGFQIEWNFECNHPKARQFCQENKVSEIMLWLGDHGDFQTLLAVPEKNLNKVLSTCAAFKKSATILGQFTKSKKFTLDYVGQDIELPLTEITNCPRDLESYCHLVKGTQEFLKAYI